MPNEIIYSNESLGHGKPAFVLTDNCMPDDMEPYYGRQHVRQMYYPKRNSNLPPVIQKPHSKNSTSNINLADEKATLDNYILEQMHETVSQDSDFNDDGQRFIPTGSDGGPSYIDMSLLEAFDNWYKFEESVRTSNDGPTKQGTQLDFSSALPHHFILHESDGESFVVPHDLQHYALSHPESDTSRTMPYLSRAQRRERLLQKMSNSFSCK